MSLLRLNWIKSTIRKSLDSCITEVPFPIPFRAFVAVFSSSIFPWISVYVVSHFFIFSVRCFFFALVCYHYLRFFRQPFFLFHVSLYMEPANDCSHCTCYFLLLLLALSLSLNRLNLHFLKKRRCFFSVFSVVIHPCCRGGKLNVFIFISLY